MRSEQFMAMLESALVANPVAIDMCVSMIEVAEIYDDLIDRDVDVSHNKVHRLMYLTMVHIPRNSFYAQFFDQINALWGASVLAWMASNDLHRGDMYDKQTAYIIRSNVIQIVHFSAMMLGGIDHAAKVGPSIWSAVRDNDSFESFCAEVS